MCSACTDACRPASIISITWRYESLLPCQEPTAGAGSGDGGSHGKLAAVCAALDDGEGQALVGGAHGVLVARVEADGGNHIRRLLAADLDNDGLGSTAAALETGGAADLHITTGVNRKKSSLCMTHWKALRTTPVQQLFELHTSWLGEASTNLKGVMRCPAGGTCPFEKPASCAT